MFTPTSFSSLRSLGARGAFALVALGAPVCASSFTAGNLVVLRVGDGSAALTSAATPVFLDEYTTGGTLVQSIPLPTTASGANQPLVNSGTATSEGFLNLSSNGQYLVHAGYAAAVGTAAIAGTTSAATPCVVARIDLNGNIDTSTALTDAYSAGNPRSVTTDDGSQFWLGGTGSSGNGVRYATYGATTSTQLSTTITNTRVVGIFNGQLYVSSSSSTFQGVSTVGTGLPNTSGQTITLLNGFPTATGPSAYDYFFADASTLYVADDRTSTAGGIQKWTESGGLWTLQYTLNPATGQGCRGLTGVVNAGVTTLYATTSLASLNTLVSVTDTGAGSTFAVIATAPTNEIFRGLRLLTAAPSLITPICDAGVGSVIPCPCSNPPSTTGRGCENSAATGGASITANGTPSLAADTLVFSTAGEKPTATSIVLQGNVFNVTGVVFGQGLRCVGGSLKRLYTKAASGGSITAPAGADPSVSARSAAAGDPISATQHRYYMVYYRDPIVLGGCPATSTFNGTNALDVQWAP